VTRPTRRTLVLRVWRVSVGFADLALEACWKRTTVREGRGGSISKKKRVKIGIPVGVG